MSTQSKIRKHKIYSALSWLIALFPLRVRWLFRFYGCDKDHPMGQDYGPTYDALIRPLKYKRFRFLEIGIGGYGDYPGGKSLLAWQSYFPFAEIVAADLHDKSGIATPRVKIEMCDQSDADALIRLAKSNGPFDLIIDDGSHINAHQILTFKTLFPYLNDGGIFVVEDVQTSYWRDDHWDGGARGTPEFRDSCMHYFLELANHLNHAEFKDLAEADAELLPFARSIKSIAFVHNLIIIRKGANDRPSNLVRRDAAPARDAA